MTSSQHSSQAATGQSANPNNIPLSDRSLQGIAQPTQQYTTRPITRQASEELPEYESLDEQDEHEQDNEENTQMDIDNPEALDRILAEEEEMNREYLARRPITRSKKQKESQEEYREVEVLNPIRTLLKRGRKKVKTKVVRVGNFEIILKKDKMSYRFSRTKMTGTCYMINRTGRTCKKPVANDFSGLCKYHRDLVANGLAATKKAAYDYKLAHDKANKLTE